MIEAGIAIVAKVHKSCAVEKRLNGQINGRSKNHRKVGRCRDHAAGSRQRIGWVTRAVEGGASHLMAEDSSAIVNRLLRCVADLRTFGSEGGISTGIGLKHPENERTVR
jgi:hypothetical protein